jgi:peptidoglycan/xylan/chitin deacetylase (PgdA/CDA1 family)
MSLIKNTLRHAVSVVYYAMGHQLTGLKGKVTLLMYHRVLTGKDLDNYYVQPGMYVRDDVFEEQMSFLEKRFRVLSLSELLDMWKDGSWDNSQKYCVVTFDDGWLDNYTNAYPSLRKHKIPATIFLPTNFIGTNEWFWPDKLGVILINSIREGNLDKANALQDKWPCLRNNKITSVKDRINSIIEHVKSLPDEEIPILIDEMAEALHQQLPDERILLNWEEVAEMSENNISFGSHSSSHSILTKLSTRRAQTEMQDSLTTLISKNVNHVPVFCYPNGNFTSEIAQLAASSGYEAAVTTRFGYESETPQNLFELKRIGIHNDVSSTVSLFAFHLSGMNNIIREALK